MNLYEWETRLQTHGQSVKHHLVHPVNLESEVWTSMKKTKRPTAGIFLAAVLAVVLGTTAFAVYHYLTASQVAGAIGDAKLEAAFETGGPLTNPVTDGDYRASVLGMVSGENLSDFPSSAWSINPERTYVAVAIERVDGKDMTYDDELLVTPLIQGLRPWQYNIYTMNGSATGQIVGGVLYRLVEFDTVAYFADRQVYLAVLSGAFYRKEAYNYDEESGLLTANPNDGGTNILFKLDLDPAQADPDRAQAYLNALEKEWESAETAEIEGEKAGATQNR